MLTYADHVGLFAEEVGPVGEPLGNFPQAFTHLALITSALSLDGQLNAARWAGSVPPTALPCDRWLHSVAGQRKRWAGARLRNSSTAESGRLARRVVRR
jgi:hypothetical protein